MPIDTPESRRLHNIEPAEDLQKIAAGESKAVADTFVRPANFSETPVVTEEQRKTGEVNNATQRLRETTGYKSGGARSEGRSGNN